MPERVPGSLYRIFDQLKKTGYMDTAGHVIIEPLFDGGAPFSEGLAAVEQDHRYGYIDEDGHFVIPFQFEQAAPFHDGLAFVTYGSGKWGIIDKLGRVVAQPQYEVSEEIRFSDGYALLKIDGKYWFLNHQGQKTFGPYAIAQPFSEGLACVVSSKGMGWIDTMGVFVIAPTYPGARSFSGGLAAVSLDVRHSLWGFIDKTAARW